MASLESSKEMIVMVLTDLAAICKKLAENAAVPEALQMRMRKYVENFNTLMSSQQGQGTGLHREEVEDLLFEIARTLPSVLEVDALKRTA